MDKHEFDIKKDFRKVEELLPRLKHAVPPSRIIKWVENFEKIHARDALDLLLFLEYISFADLQLLLNEQLLKVIGRIPPDAPVIIIPYGKPGKSGPMMVYPLKKTPAFNKISKRTQLSWDYVSLKVKKGSHLILVDDFIGTGDSFHKAYNKGIKEWVKEHAIESVSLVACFTMLEGQTDIQKKHEEVQVYAELRNKIFDPDHSPYRVLKKEKTLKKVADWYGNQMELQQYEPKKWPMGYGGSEALLAFAHGTPNNTLPIIWSSYKWRPLFPREASVRINEAKKIKKDIAFFIGVMNRLGLDLYTNKTLTLTAGGRKRKRKYNSKTDFSLLLLLKMKREGYHDILIAQVLGLTLNDLDGIYKEAKNKKYIDAGGNITPLGRLFYDQLLKNARRTKFRAHIPENFKLKETNYIPISFGGVS